MLQGHEKYDRDLLDSLQKNYQIFLESPNGEINVFLVLSSQQTTDETIRENRSEKFFSFDGKERVLVDSRNVHTKVTNENMDIRCVDI